MGRHLRNATAIRVNNFNARRGSNLTCQEFNGGTMFEAEQGVFSGFQGHSTNTDGTFAFASVPQGFSRASGVRKKKLSSTQADAPAAKQLAGTDCSGANCGSGYGGVGCPQIGCGCTDKAYGTCSGSQGGVLRTYSNAEIMEDYRKKQRQGGAAKQKSSKTLTDARRKRQIQGGTPPSELTPYCPDGKCWGMSKCVPCDDAIANAAFGGKPTFARNFGGGDVYARNFGGGSVYSRNFGGGDVYSRNFGGNSVFK